MKRYQLHADYTFPTGWPFDFDNFNDAKELCRYLNRMTKQFKEWNELEKFQIWDRLTNQFVKLKDEN